MGARKFKLFMGCLGNGITVCNSAVMENGDYKKVCHIDQRGVIKWYVKPSYVPKEDAQKITETAQAETAKYNAWLDTLPPLARMQEQMKYMTASQQIEFMRKRREERAAESDI